MLQERIEASLALLVEKFEHERERGEVSSWWVRVGGLSSLHNGRYGVSAYFQWKLDWISFRRDGGTKKKLPTRNIALHD